MKFTRIFLLLTSIALLTLASPRAAQAVAPTAFTIVVLPDTQHYTELAPEIFTAQTQWIVDNKAAENIKFVLHEGDITENNIHTEWQRVDALFRNLRLLADSSPSTAVGPKPATKLEDQRLIMSHAREATTILPAHHATSMVGIATRILNPVSVRVQARPHRL